MTLPVENDQQRAVALEQAQKFITASQALIAELKEMTEEGKHPPYESVLSKVIVLRAMESQIQELHNAVMVYDQENWVWKKEKDDVSRPIGSMLRSIFSNPFKRRP